MNSKDYWAKRSALDMVAYMRTADRTATLMRQTSEQALDIIQSEIKGIFSAFSGFGISEEEARRILSGDGTMLQRIRRAAEKVKDPKQKQALLSAINSAGAYRYRIKRLEAVSKQITAQCRELYKAQLKDTTAALRSVADDAYYHTIFNIQKETGLAFSFAQFPKKQIDRILAFNWSGAHFSQRIWRSTDILAQSIKDELLISLLSGRSNAKTMAAIREQFGVNSFCAWRLVRTESSYVSNAAVAEGYNEADIEKYRFLATLDSRTSEKCAELDSKVFLLADKTVGTNFPPMHPFCRSTTLAEFGEEVMAKLQRRARDKDGNLMNVPADMSFEEWKKSLDKSAESGIIDTGIGFNTIQSEHKINDDIGTLDKPVCNPRYITGKKEYTHNCGNCSVAYEMRRRGYDVEATPMVNMYVADWEKLFIGAKTIHSTFKPRADVADVLRNKILKFNPSGARGSIFVQWKNSSSGHFFSWEIIGDNVRFLDAQNGDINVSRYFQSAKPSSILYQRWDNLEPSDMAINACKNKE